jgi:hypothetical protein
MAESINFLSSLVLLFGGGLFLDRWLSGWGQLEKVYKCNENPNNNQILRGSRRWARSQIRFTEMWLAVELYPSGLWLRPFFPFNIGLKALCIPWEAIQCAERNRNFFRLSATLHVERCPFPIRIFGKAGVEILAAHAKAKNPVPLLHNSLLHTDAQARR